MKININALNTRDYVMISNLGLFMYYWENTNTSFFCKGVRFNFRSKKTEIQIRREYRKEACKISFLGSSK